MVHPIQIQAIGPWVKCLKVHSPCTTKIALVALSCFGFLTLQFSFPYVLAAKISVSCATVCFACDVIFPKKSSEDLLWLNTTHMTISSWALGFFSHQMLNIMKTILLFGSNGSIPIQEVSKKILNYDPKLLVISLIIAPICEELLFRGFLVERLYDLMHVASIIIPLTDEVQKKIAHVVQAALFGLMHILFGQVQEFKYRVIVFCDTMFLSLVSQEMKSSTKSLVPSICYHALANLNATLSMFSKKMQLQS
jgi:membrane protease YdiL (CAAX protease family)